MLQGLVIRQTFLVIDWLLIALVVAGGVFLALTFVEKPQEAQIPAPPELAAEAQSRLAQVQPRPIYESLVTSGLFGDAGDASAAQAPPPPPPVEVTETELKLKLRGTAATSPKDLYASAIILNEDSGAIATYAIGQQVVEGVTLEEIHQRKVLLFNSKTNRREVLRSDEDTEDGAPPAPLAAAASTPQPEGPGKRISVKKNELVQEVFMNYSDLISTVKPELYYDKTGKVAGITASNLDKIPLASKLDIRNGDVFMSVNNETIDSEGKIMELVNKYRDSNMVRIGILREGKPMTITYRLD